MKKNRMMRLASILLVCVLMTTSVISGTFAKYVTTNSGADSARVAKFGVVINVADDMGVFKTEYNKEDANYAGTLSVKSNTTTGTNDDNRVAPGTEGFMTFNITGTPEVATRLTVEAEGTSIQLAADTYELPEGKFSNKTTSVTTTAVYEPIKFYFGKDVTTVPANAEYKLTLEQLKAELVNMKADFDPNAVLNKNYVIAWKWAFENDFTEGTFDADPYDGAKVVNFLDTYLGNEETLKTETLNFKITVEQID